MLKKRTYYNDLQIETLGVMTKVGLMNRKRLFGAVQ
jgi:hypothetical protein